MLTMEHIRMSLHQTQQVVVQQLVLVSDHATLIVL
jgi:hypothetical protein